TPGGSVTSARRTLDWARPVPGSGWVRATVTAVGVSRAAGDSCTPSEGVKGTPGQSVGVKDDVAVAVAFAYEVAVNRDCAGSQLVGFVRNAFVPPLTSPFNVRDMVVTVMSESKPMPVPRRSSLAVRGMFAIDVS